MATPADVKTADAKLAEPPSRRAPLASRNYLVPVTTFAAVFVGCIVSVLLFGSLQKHSEKIAAVEEKLVVQGDRLDRFERRVGRVAEKLATSNRSIRDLVEVCFTSW